VEVSEGRREPNDPRAPSEIERCPPHPVRRSVCRNGPECKADPDYRRSALTRTEVALEGSGSRSSVVSMIIGHPIGQKARSTNSRMVSGGDQNTGNEVRTRLVAEKSNASTYSFDRVAVQRRVGTNYNRPRHQHRNDRSSHRLCNANCCSCARDLTADT
jgi:hypothetical protein